VIARFLETFFRFKFLIVLPAIITPLIVIPFALLLVKPYYETTAGLWVERPVYVPTTEDWNRYVTPAQNQQQRLTELLKTRSFVEDIARRSGLGPLLDTPDGRDDVFEYIGKVITTTPVGSKLLQIQVRADDPDISMAIIQASVAALRDRNANERMQQATASIAFYEQQANEASQTVSDSRERLRRYVAANPRLAADASSSASVPRSSLSAAVLDPQLNDMLRRVESDEKENERLRGLVEQAKFEASAALEGNDSSLQVLDAPIYPTRAQRERRRVLVFPIAGVAIGALISGLLLVALTAADRSVRSTADLQPMGRVLGVVPRMGLRRLPRQAGPETTRRAIAFVAGTTMPALPAPRSAS
jgi:capsular polysaccharide biosynthesis protein